MEFHSQITLFLESGYWVLLLRIQSLLRGAPRLALGSAGKWPVVSQSECSSGVWRVACLALPQHRVWVPQPLPRRAMGTCLRKMLHCLVHGPQWGDHALTDDRQL